MKKRKPSRIKIANQPLPWSKTMTKALNERPLEHPVNIYYDHLLHNRATFTDIIHYLVTTAYNQGHSDHRQEVSKALTKLINPDIHSNFVNNEPF